VTERVEEDAIVLRCQATVIRALTGPCAGAEVAGFEKAGPPGELTDPAPALGALRSMSGLLRAMNEGNESVMYRAPAELAGHLAELRDRPESRVSPRTSAAIAPGWSSGSTNHCGHR
jgi:hypothetical protein